MALLDNPIIHLYRMQWRYSEGRRAKVVLFVIMFILGNIIYLIEPYIIGKIFELIQLNSTSADFLWTFFGLISLLFLTNLGFWMFHGPARVMENNNAYLIQRDYQMRLFSYVLALPASWHRDHHSGDTIDKINRASKGLESFSSHNFLVIEMIMRLVGSAAALFLLDRAIGSFVFIISLLTLVCIRRFDKILYQQYIQLYKMFGFIAAGVYDYISNIFTVITLRLPERAKKEIDRRIMAAMPLQRKNNVVNELKWFFASTMIITMTVVVLGWVGYRSYATTGIVVIGTLYMFFGYLQRMGETFYNFAGHYGTIVENHASVGAADYIIEAYDKLPLHLDAELSPGWKTISISDLSFSYGKHFGKRIHLDNVNIKFHKGQHIAFIGKSGSGKSTMMAILRGLYPAPHVIVESDGKTLEHGLAHLYEHSTLIPQHPELFKNSVEYNITMGLHVPMNKIREVLRLSRFDQVVRRLKKGLQTNVMERGVSLSGGEKQRLALARGLLAAERSDILLLDEPTSSVDSPNERAIYTSILKKYPHKTIISAIHRLHLLHLFDYIYYFKDGKVIAEGSFSELLKNKHFKPVWALYHKKH